MLSFSLLVSGMAPVPGDKNRCVRAAHILSLPLCPSALARHAPATRKNVCACVSAHMHSLCSPSPRARRDTTLATPRAPPALPLCPATLKRAARPRPLTDCSAAAVRYVRAQVLLRALRARVRGQAPHQHLDRDVRQAVHQRWGRRRLLQPGRRPQVSIARPNRRRPARPLPPPRCLPGRATRPAQVRLCARPGRVHRGHVDLGVLVVRRAHPGRTRGLLRHVGAQVRLRHVQGRLQAPGARLD